jgi:hypothetical protein
MNSSSVLGRPFSEGGPGKEEVLQFEMLQVEISNCYTSSSLGPPLESDPVPVNENEFVCEGLVEQPIGDVSQCCKPISYFSK